MSIIISCQSGPAAASKLNFATAETFLNVPYGKDTAQKMDVYLPAHRSTDSTKAIILIHGGGWNGGNKSDFAAYIDSFRHRMPHYAIFNLNYRLVNGSQLFPAQENDVRAAVDFIVKQSHYYGIDSNKLVLLGASAGGHLALLQAYKYHEPRVRAVIDFFGPTDLLAMYRHPWHPLVTYALQMVTGTTLQENPEIFKQSSPVTFVNRKSPPTLIFHGGKDMIVNISQSRELQQKLEQHGVPNDLIVYPGEQHGWYGRTLHDSFDRVERFLKTYLP